MRGHASHLERVRGGFLEEVVVKLNLQNMQELERQRRETAAHSKTKEHYSLDVVKEI